MALDTPRPRIGSWLKLELVYFPGEALSEEVDGGGGGGEQHKCCQPSPWRHDWVPLLHRKKKKNTVDTPGERGEMLPSRLTLITLCSATLQTSIRGQIYSTPFVSPLFKLRYRPHAIFPRSRLGCHYPRRTKGASSLGSRAAPLGKKWPLSWNWRKTWPQFLLVVNEGWLHT